MTLKKPSYRKNKPPVGLVLGAAGLGGVWGEINPEESIQTILYALENGIDRIDTAPAYSRSEELVGKALRRWKGAKPFVSTKVGRLKGESAEVSINNYEINIMRESVAKSMELLGCQKLDLLFLHEAEKVPLAQIPDVVDFLVQLKKHGIAENIGFGGMPPPVYFEYVQKGLFDVVMGYNNLDACCIDGMDTDIPFLTQQGMVIYQGSPLHMGLLGNRFASFTTDPPNWITKRDVDNTLMANSLANQYELPLSTLAHRFILSIGEVDYMVIGAKNMMELRGTLNDCAMGKLEKEIHNKLIERIK
ncbi:MAG: aldo/keto reductase [Cyclobacteriaceae bacterium]